MVKSKIEDLTAFIAVVDTGGFSSAAEALDLQVAKVSRSVSRLEQSLNTTLLNRTTRRVDLTEEGRLFLAEAKQALATLTNAEEKLLFADAKPSGRLRIDAASPFILHQLVPLMAEFTAAYPDISVELISNESIIDLLERRTDVAIRIGQLNDSNLHASRLGESPLKIVATPEYLAKHGKPESIAALANHQIVGFADLPKFNDWALVEPCQTKPSILASSGESVRQLVLHHHGLALLSNFMIYRDLAAGRLVELLPGAVHSPNPWEQIQAVYYKQTALSERIRVFIDFLKANIRL